MRFSQWCLRLMVYLTIFGVFAGTVHWLPSRFGILGMALLAVALFAAFRLLVDTVDLCVGRWVRRGKRGAPFVYYVDNRHILIPPPFCKFSDAFYQGLEDEVLHHEDADYGVQLYRR